MIKKCKICFVSPSSFPLLKEKNLGFVGGAEVQQVELAKELNRRMYWVFFVTYGDNNHRDVENIDGITLVPSYDVEEIKKLNYLQKALCIWRKMKEIDADIYIHRSGAPGIASLFRIIHHKKMIYLIASDSYVTSENIIKKDNIGRFFSKLGNWLDIKFSDIVIAQNIFQQKILQKRYNVKSIIIRNAFNIPSIIKVINEKYYILWIGTIRSIKQPELFLDIAKHFPEYNFVMIGGEGEDPELFKKIKNSAQAIDNLDFKGFIPHSQIYEYYKNSILFISTSKTEGFPNVFLEAWLYSVPVISLNVDPDGIILKYKLGFHSKTFDIMVENVKTLMVDKKLREEIGMNGRKYVEEEHDINKIVRKYIELFEKLVKNND